MNEFEIIDKYFAPLTNKYPGALDLKDDAAYITPASGYDIVITKDAIVENVHFFENNSPVDIALKLLAVNVSDLASMGAYPTAYLLGLTLPKSINAQWIEEFSQGLRQGVEKFGGNMKLIGGDTTSHHGPLSMTLTAIGEVPTGKAITRSGAQIGDHIYVTGSIGDSYLGLQILSNKLDFKSDYLIDRYLHPIPRVKTGLKLIGIATACTDISDGLIADLGHICQYSKVGAEIFTSNIPLSDDAKKSAIDIKHLITGGDDYELLFTAPPFANLPKNITQIGKITDNNIVKIISDNGEELYIKDTGYKHFL